MSYYGTSSALPANNKPPKKRTTGIRRFLRYFQLRFIRLRGSPHELALGMALGIFTGSMPVMPFQIAIAVLLALIFKGSKIAAALGTWISNPLNWYFLYYYSYKVGAAILQLPNTNGVFASVMTSVRNSEDGWLIAGKIVNAGGNMIAAFLIGGLVLGLVIAPPFYFVFLKVFRSLEQWRLKRGNRR